MRKIIYLLFCCLNIVFFSCKSKDNKSATPQQQAAQKPPALPVEAIVANTRQLNSAIETAGNIMAYETTEIHPEVSGRLVYLNLNEGAMVGKGTLLAKIYDGDLQAQLKKLEVQLKIAQETENRSGQLLKIQGISQQDYDLTLLQVHNIQADMEIIKTSISKTNILAPYSGKLGLKKISPGAYVTPATILTTISQVNEMKIQFDVPEKYGAAMKKGGTVNFTVDGSNNTFTARIIASEASIEQDTRSLAIRAVVSSRDPALIPGAFAKVKIGLGSNGDALMIPNNSLVPLGRNKIIFLLRGNKAVSTQITTGVRDSTNIQVLTGLNKGDTVITSALLFLKDGSDVKLTKINTQ
jgi:membrane fusion protein, multidrug efflux system